MVYPVLTNEEMTTESQRYNSFIRNGGNAFPNQAGPEAKGSNPTTGLTLLWARNPFRGNFNQWQVSRKEAGLSFFGSKFQPCGRKALQVFFIHVTSLFQLFDRPERNFFVILAGFSQWLQTKDRDRTEILSKRPHLNYFPVHETS